MSFILDALRKSEIERQRQSGPSIAELPVAREDRRLPVALLAIGLLLAVNVGVLLFFLVRDAGAPAADAPPAAAIAAPAVAAPGPPPVPVMASAAPAKDVNPDEDAAPAADFSEAATLPPQAPDPTLLPDTPVATAGSGVTYSEGPAPSNASVAALTAGLPELTIDLHIFTDDPARRAVFINGRRYTQGDSIAEGPRVEEITRDGAVLNYRGQRFLLPRM
ncbi:MAG: general secretion pathway protein GspB [Steroidobacteraceae bacterium]